MRKIYENIKQKRLELKMSQEELARKCGYTGRSIISYIESGKINLSYDKILLFADALQVPPEELMGYEEPQETGEFLADLFRDKRLLSYAKTISELSPDKRKSVYDYVDFVSRSTKP